MGGHHGTSTQARLVGLRLSQPALLRFRATRPRQPPPAWLVQQGPRHPLPALHRLWQELLRARRHPLFRSRLPQDKAVQIAQHLAEGNGMRPTSRLCGVSLNTVLRFALRAGKHAENFHDELVQHVAVRQVQADEAWSFVGKKGRALRSCGSR